MIGLDSNILIRLATGESPAQAAACKAFVLAELSEEKPGPFAAGAALNAVPEGHAGTCFHRAPDVGRNRTPAADRALTGATPLLYEHM